MKSLKAKLILIFTSVILLLTAGLGFVSIQVTSKNLENDARADLETIAISEAKYIKSKKDAELKYIDALSRNPIIVDEAIPLDQKIAFCEAEAEKTGFLAFAFADKNGDSIIFDSKKDKINVADREYFQMAMQGKTFASDLVKSGVTGELVLIYAAPVYRNGQLVGVLYGRRDGLALSKITEEITYGETGYGYVINNDGIVVGHPEINLVLKQYNMEQAVEENPEYVDLSNLIKSQVLLRESGSGDYSFEGTKNIVGFAPVADSP